MSSGRGGTELVVDVVAVVVILVVVAVVYLASPGLSPHFNPAKTVSSGVGRRNEALRSFTKPGTIL